MTKLETSHTWQEIHAQPGIWQAWAEPLAAQSAEIREWIAAKGIKHIVFSGAGTSAFIGQALASTKTGAISLAAIATTDIVSNPSETLSDDAELLVVQFGRSGNSSETIATLDLLDEHFPKVHRLNITCNGESALAVRPAKGPGEQRVIVLPEATHDRAFAMTSSYTTMLLSALACIDDTADVSTKLGQLSAAAAKAIAQLDATPAPHPERAIFLGSGALTGVARESALKVLELTAGQVMTNWDSTLGFRHGPKASVVGNTRVVVFIHPDQHTARYDLDIAHEIAQQFPLATVTTVGGEGCDLALALTGANHRGDSRWDAVLYVLLAQIWSARWSAELDLNIDNPFIDQGNLTRVVSGVKIYPFKA
ncbi:SIS domain-containing protein [Brucella grignonensis]|uniref:SIS domain protein n=1 Tax=Brucella grignonensis TaxID=94627 RepID=A0A256FPS3_9HYPH|nr:SIS domain-containing protein [Brucella grignonensis]OYR16421.1 SIS domain protein [Brucella grignonensis]